VLEGEPVYFPSIASNREQARVALNQVRRLVRRSPLLRAAVARETEDAIEFSNGSIVTTFVCSARSIRGFPVAACLLDELGFFVSSEDGPAAASEVWRAIRPSLAQFGPARRLMVSSTPNGDNLFKTVFDGAVLDAERPGSGVAVFQAPTWQCNLTLPQNDPFYDTERRALGEQFDAEYGARFLGSGSALLAEADIRACVRPGAELDPLEADGWVVGADFAWRRDRSAAVVVGHERGYPDRLVVGAVRTWEPERDLSQGTERHQNMVLREVAQLAEQYGGGPVFCDTHESQTVQSKLQSFRARCEIEALGSGRKGDVFKELARHVRGGSVSFPDHPLRISELRRLRDRYGGQFLSIENPRAGGGHGDVAMAMA
jgi:hypothetical protein